MALSSSKVPQSLLEQILIHILLIEFALLKIIRLSLKLSVPVVRQYFAT
ncbi:hypothetical protein VCHA56P521_210048 [Vibrio chagasii]|nr:hypothetical protein VCHA36P168_160069 [Vibrio chagasii]CAH7062912.1 hypothetical protein VCHA52P461_170031 [Vibrio chagasii]CAH7313088.1 hypothetical protein VCHA37P203_210050 [Vibrio chagasii]CAH7331025.1 hypothetical protein VCHA56P521_210048 [Vibrio chagasii]